MLAFKHDTILNIFFVHQFSFCTFDPLCSYFTAEGVNLPFQHFNTDGQFFLKLEVVFTINMYYLSDSMNRSATECKTEKSIEWVKISNRLAMYELYGTFPQLWFRETPEFLLSSTFHFWQSWSQLQKIVWRRGGFAKYKFKSWSLENGTEKRIVKYFDCMWQFLIRFSLHSI